MSLRLGTIDERTPVLSQSGQHTARLWLVGQGGAMYRFDRPARGPRFRSRLVYVMGVLVLASLLAGALIAALYVKDVLQGLLLLLALAG